MTRKFAIIAAVLLTLLSAFVFSAYRQNQAEAPLKKYRQTMEAMERIAKAIDLYSTDFGCVPRIATIQELKKLLVGPYIGNVPQDAWGHDFLYKFNETNPLKYWLASAGSDSIFKGFEQQERWDSFQGQDIVLTNEPSSWTCAPDPKVVTLPDVLPISGYQTLLNPGTTLGIVRRPAAVDFTSIHDGKLDVLPVYDPNSDKGWQVDLRSTDVSGLELSNRLGDLLQADFDSKTRWPKHLPQGFDPVRFMELGKNPGLGIRRLHQLGITGKGVGIAIIDQALLVDHSEYKDRLRMYEEIHNSGDIAAMHGPAVASIAVGKTVGVAPDADLYYIAETHGINSKDGFDWDFTFLAQSIERILEVNHRLPAANRIRVISISVGWGPQQKGYAAMTAALDKAKKEGIFVVSSSISDTYDHQFYFHGLGREPGADPEVANSYEPGSWWSRQFFSGKPLAVEGKVMLLVPMDARCTASPTGINDYVFYRQGGWSWSIPYIAGLYALACQVDPGITPRAFWAKALRTGDTIEIEKDSKKFLLGKIVNPLRMLKK